MKKIILAIDIQNEYIKQDSPFNIKSIKRSLDNIHQIFNHARDKGIMVCHMQHVQENKYFIKDENSSLFIENFEPIDGELSFQKDMYSCFSSKAFTQYLAEINPDEIIIVGYGTSMCCTCTIIEGIHKGYKFTLVEDGTASRSFPHATEEEMHNSACNVLKQFAQLKNTSQIITEFDKQ